MEKVDVILGPSGNRSAFVEQALRAFLIVRAQQIRDANDLEILNRRANRLNYEGEASR